MAAMKDSSKRKEELAAKKSSKKIIGAVGVAQTPGQMDQELQETQQYWMDAVGTLRDEQFASLEVAVERVVELAAERLGSIASNEQTQAFMKAALLSSEEVVETLRETLQIQEED